MTDPPGRPDASRHRHRRRGTDTGRYVVLGVWAEPGDESRLSAALMHRITAAGGHVQVVCATRGVVDSPDRSDRLELAALRELELRRALAGLGVFDVWVLGLPSGFGATTTGADEAAGHIGLALHSTRPDLVLTFGGDGRSGQEDRLAVHRWTTEAWTEAPPSDRGHLMFAAAGPHAAGIMRIEPDPIECRAKRAALSIYGDALLDRGPDASTCSGPLMVEAFREPTDAELRAARTS